MTEEEARAWIADRFGGRGVDRVAAVLNLVIAEAAKQNLIAPSTVAQIWNRHAADSAQLVALGRPEGVWLDIGTGGGFPGLVVAALREAPMVLVEPRRRRAEFLADAAAKLRFDHVCVEATRVESVAVPAAVISARAVAPVEKLLAAAQPCAMPHTRWLLPRGQLDVRDLDEFRRDWHGMFHVEQSVTDPLSSILIAEGVRRR